MVVNSVFFFLRSLEAKKGRDNVVLNKHKPYAYIVSLCFIYSKSFYMYVYIYISTHYTFAN